MKKEIHPKYQATKVTCSCGAKFEVSSIEPEIKVEICSDCHPAYTGKKKFIDTAGRLDRFRARLEKTKQLQKKLGEIKTKKKEEEKEKQAEEKDSDGK